MGNVEDHYHQRKNIQYINDFYGKEIWVQVSGHRELNNTDAVFWAALISLDKMQDVYRDIGWDSSVGTQSPGFVEIDGVATYKELPYDMGSCENIVHYREFYGIKPNYVEISEEFRLLNGLYCDMKNNKYYTISENGESIEVAKIENQTCAYIKLQYLIRYASAKQKALLLFFDIRSKIAGSLKENNLIPFSETVKEENLFYGIWGDEMRMSTPYTYSVLMGKKIILPKPVEQCGYWPYEEKYDYLDYIIGIDKDGDPETFTSDPNKLANYFGANPDAPHYLTPVFFKKEVLQKYLSHPEIYSVEDGYLRCQSLWGMAIDNHHKECVSAYLGDLGRDLPVQEQLYWKSYNIVSEEKLSAVKFKRDFLCQFTDAEISDLKFKADYNRFQKQWLEKYNWNFFLPLSEDDEYNLQLLHIPVTNSQEEFDHLVLSLVKSIIDSLNEKEILKKITNKDDLKGGISKLERWFAEINIQDYEEQIKFLRDLQELRSSGTGHRKGKGYLRIASTFNVEDNNFSDVFEAILQRADNFILFLCNKFI